MKSNRLRQCPTCQEILYQFQHCYHSMPSFNSPNSRAISISRNMESDHLPASSSYPRSTPADLEDCLLLPWEHRCNSQLSSSQAVYGLGPGVFRKDLPLPLSLSSTSHPLPEPRSAGRRLEWYSLKFGVVPVWWSAERTVKPHIYVNPAVDIIVVINWGL